jgi:hypothetical protein
VIRKRGDKFVVTAKSGRTLGTHRTRKAAVRQLGAVEASKARKTKKRKR